MKRAQNVSSCSKFSNFFTTSWHKIPLPSGDQFLIPAGSSSAANAKTSPSAM
jgi:hypothetical protein